VLNDCGVGADGPEQEPIERKPFLSMGTPSMPWDLLLSRQNGYLGFRPVSTPYEAFMLVDDTGNQTRMPSCVSTSLCEARAR
jgi:hypothetical protein